MGVGGGVRRGTNGGGVRGQEGTHGGGVRRGHMGVGSGVGQEACFQIQ